MNLKFRLKYFFGSAALCSVLFAVAGLCILLPRPSSYSDSVADVYTPNPLPGSLLLIEVDSIGGIGVYVDYAARRIYTAYLPAESLPADAEISRISAARDNFCEFIDKCNGTLYTKNDQTVYTVMGNDLANYMAACDGEAVAQIAASFLQKMLLEGSIELLEEAIIRLSDCSGGNFSYVKWAGHRSALEQLGEDGSVIPLPSADFVKLIKE